MGTLAISIASLLCFLPLGTGYSVITRVPVGMIDENGSILLATELDRYTDISKGLTAVKDPHFLSCYIKETDPMWNPGAADKEEIMRTNIPETVSNAEDEFELRKKAGDTISEMCKPFNIYWATLPPPPMLPVATENRLGPPPSRLVPGSMNAPPVNPPMEQISIDQLPVEIQQMIGEHDGNEIAEIPSLIGDQQMDGNGFDIKTPPPLAIYLQQHQSHLDRDFSLDGSDMKPPMKDEDGNLLIEPPMRGAPPMMGDLSVREPPRIHGKPPRMPGEPPRNPPPPPAIHVEREVMLEPPTPKMDRPEMKEPEMAPPPLNVWQRMLASIKGAETIAPPLPDMIAPEYKYRK